jgi:cysteinyl-tRNA synthetase
MKTHWIGGTLALAVMCLGTGVSAMAAGDLGPLPVEVWNQAYQETYEPDSIADILAGANNAYVLIDPFQPEHGDTMPGVIDALHAKGNVVSAYISIGTGETWRDDFAALKPHLVDKQWDDWGGEYFVSMPNEAVIAIMKSRIDKIAAWGFDWVEFDNMDWVYDDDYRAEYNFAASVADGVAYYRALCDHVHARGMKCMAKSTVESAEIFDGVTYESYEDDRNWWDEAGAQSFLAVGKPVVIVHYDAPDCAAILAEYQQIYGPKLSFICEDRSRQAYRHMRGS